MYKFLLGLMFVLFLVSCSKTPDTEYYKDSHAPLVDFSRFGTYEDYINFTKKRLYEYRVWFDENNQQQELTAIAPYIFEPPAHCAQPTRGVLLIHGLYDTAFGLKDIGRELQKNCFLVYGLLLPGHGTRVGDLIGINRSQWVAAAKMGVELLSRRTENVSVLGYSLGGALASAMGLEFKHLQALVLIAPAYEISQNFLSMLTIGVRYLKDYVGLYPRYVSVRYQSLPTNSIAQTYLIGKEVRDKLEKHSFKMPVLMINSINDETINPQVNLDYYQQYMSNPANKKIVYYSTLAPVEGVVVDEDFIDVFDAKAKVNNFSHIGYASKPDNPIYGKNGVYRECGKTLAGTPSEDVVECEKGVDNFIGVLTTIKDKKYLPMQRMSYNPHFESMVATIVKFLQQ